MENIWLAGATESVLFGRRRSRVGLAFGDWLAEYTAVPVKRSIYRDTEVTQVFLLAHVAPWIIL